MNTRTPRILLLSFGALGLTLGAGAAAARAQSICGSAAALRSGGTTAGGSHTLAEIGYVGACLPLSAPATVNFSVSAHGAFAGGAAPRMNLVVNDAKFG